MRVMISTLCQQGQVYANFMLSVVELYQHSTLQKQEAAKQIISQIPNFNAQDPSHKAQFDANMNHHTIDFGIYAQSGESLLARGRNHGAQAALTQGYDKIIYIDADEAFTWSDVYALAMSEYPIAAGVVPLKTFPIPGSFETSLNFLPFLEDEIFFDDSLRTLKSTIRMSKAKKSQWVEVAYTGTGFLCVDLSVFAKLAETSGEYIYPNPINANPELHWSFFDGGPMHERYLSEDWAFCEKARAAGFKVTINTNVRIKHTGPHEFRAG